MADAKTFDVLAAIEGRSYPEDEKTVYTDEAGLFELHKINEEQKYIGDVESKEYKAIERRKKTLIKQVSASALTFKGRGVAPAVIQTLAKKYQDSEDYEALQDEIVAAVLISVTNADGEVDQRKFTTEDAQKLRHLLPQGAYETIGQMVNDLNVGSVIYDSTVDAGFLPKS